MEREELQQGGIKAPGGTGRALDSTGTISSVPFYEFEGPGVGYPANDYEELWEDNAGWRAIEAELVGRLRILRQRRLRKEPVTVESVHAIAPAVATSRWINPDDARLTWLLAHQEAGTAEIRAFDAGWDAACASQTAEIERLRLTILAEISWRAELRHKYEAVVEAGNRVQVESGYRDMPEPYGPRPSDYPDAYEALEMALTDYDKEHA